MGIGRSENMRRIKSKDSTPEIAVRKLLRHLGYLGYRLHRRDLPGKPDIAFIGKRKLIFVHGCFWHGHNCNEGLRTPKTNQEYWVKKISANKLRDNFQLQLLESSGWSVLTIWECEVRNKERLQNTLDSFMRPII